MPRLLSTTATLLVLISSAISQTATQIQKAIGRIELRSDRPCVPNEFHKGKAYDVLKLLLQSDGKRITIAATLKDPAPAGPGNVLDLHFDTDNNPKTGGAVLFAGEKRDGFEFESDIEACARYSNGNACGDTVITGGKVISLYTFASLQRFSEPESYEFSDKIIDLGTSDGFGSSWKSATKEPIVGNMVHATLNYADLKVQPGQTIRIVLEKKCGLPFDDPYFPEVLLVLK